MAIQQDSRWSAEIQSAPPQNETKQANEHTACPGRSVAGGRNAARVNEGWHKRLGNGERIAHYRVVRMRRGGFHLGAPPGRIKKVYAFAFPRGRGGSDEEIRRRREWIAWKLNRPNRDNCGEFSLREKL